MIADKLKKSILQAAIQGKLTQQLPTDGDARDLLNQIRAEKNKLIADSKIKPEKPLPPIQPEEIPFDIPQNWQWVRLGDILRVINGDRGKNYPAKSLLKISGEIPFISASNILNKSISKDNLLYVTQEQFDKLNSGKLKINDLVLCIRGSLGKNCIYPFQRGAIASSLVILRIFNEDNSMLRFISSYLDTLLFYDEIHKYDNGTAQPNLAAQNVLKFLFPLPPLAEQERIVARLEKILPEVELLAESERELHDLQKNFPRQIKNSILQDAIQGKLTQQLPTDGDAKDLLNQIRAEKNKLIAEGKLKPEKPLSPIQPDEIPFDIPQNWQWVRFGDISLKIQYGFTTSANTVGNVKLLRITDIQNDKVDWKKVPRCTISESQKKEYLLQENNLVIARTGGTVGKTFVIENLQDDSVFASYLIRAIFGKNISAKYIKIFSGSPIYWQQIIDNVKGTGQPNVNGQSLSKLIIPLPPLAEQERIVARLEKLLPLCEI